MKNIILYSLMCALLCMTACNDEEKLISSERPEFGYHVPQGDHEYDARIVEWKERCNFFILYNFLPRDIYWSVTGWNEASEYDTPMGDVTWESGLKAECADENYVGDQLDLFENNFLQFYPDTMLRRCMSLKVLLCSTLFNVSNDGSQTLANAVRGYDYLAINWGSEDVMSLTAAKKKKFRVDVNTVFLSGLVKNNRIVQDDDFFKGTNYTDSLTMKTMYERGFVINSKKIEDDWDNYIHAIVSTSYDVLTAEPKVNDYTNKGILNPIKDKKGLISKKYNILINHFKVNYGVDLQAIGNAKDE